MGVWVFSIVLDSRGRDDDRGGLLEKATFEQGTEWWARLGDSGGRVRCIELKVSSQRCLPKSSDVWTELWRIDRSNPGARGSVSWRSVLGNGSRICKISGEKEQNVYVCGWKRWSCGRWSLVSPLPGKIALLVSGPGFLCAFFSVLVAFFLMTSRNI